MNNMNGVEEQRFNNRWKKLVVFPKQEEKEGGGDIE